MSENMDIPKIEEFITEKEYDLSSEVVYTDKSGLGCKTKRVKLIAIKINDGVEISDIITKGLGISKALEKIIEKGYIVPCDDKDGKISVSSFTFRTARELFSEYYDNFF
tara:strand:- start:32893 stop:33219 length:327 start_codon:yes stop_codon:yes gene_type:complete